MHNMRLVAALIVAAALTLGCVEKPPAQPAVDVAAEAQAIRDRSAEWLQLAVARDAVGVANGMYTADAVTLFDGDMSHGTAEIQASMEADTASNPDSTITWSTSHVHVAASGDLAYELGSFTFDPDGAGEAPGVNGEYVTVWVKSDGTWRAAADAGTTGKPAAVEGV